MGEPGRSQQDTGVDAKQALGDSAQAAGVGVATSMASGTVLRLCPRTVLIL